MGDLGSLQTFMMQIWNVFDYSINLPFIGLTSFLKITIFFSLLGLLGTFVNGIFGGKND